jgi:anti-sigma factor RsiW
MNSHPTTEQLSAFLDGEQTGADRASLEAHVASCAACSGVLDALRATLSDLRSLSEPEMPEQDSWALRGAVARARKRPERLARWTVAGGGVAATVAAILMFTGGGAPDRAALTAGGAEMSLQAASHFVVQDKNYSEKAAAKLLAMPRVTSAMTSVAGASGAGMAAPQAKSGPGSMDSAARPTAPNYTAAIARCDAQIRASAKNTTTLEQAIVARYRGERAFLLIYSAADRSELWVVARDTCEVRYFKQA